MRTLVCIHIQHYTEYMYKYIHTIFTFKYIYIYMYVYIYICIYIYMYIYIYWCFFSFTIHTYIYSKKVSIGMYVDQQDITTYCSILFRACGLRSMGWQDPILGTSGPQDAQEFKGASCSSWGYPKSWMVRFKDGYPPVIKHGLLENTWFSLGILLYWNAYFEWISKLPRLITRG